MRMLKLSSGNGSHVILYILCTGSLKVHDYATSATAATTTTTTTTTNNNNNNNNLY